MTLPVVYPFPMPTGLEQYPNGRIPVTELVQVGDKGFLHKLVAVAYNMLLFVARVEARLALTYTYGGLYRNLDQQIAAFHARFEPVSYATYLVTGTSRRAKFDGKFYRLRRNPNGTYMARVAVPYRDTDGVIKGTSNHGKAIAWDMALGLHPAEARSLTDSASAWLVDNVHRCGFSYESQDERWHVRYVLGNQLPAEFGRYYGALTSPRLSVMSPPEHRDAIVLAQTKLGVTADGQFGPVTHQRVIEWQQFLGQPATGIIEPELWWFLLQ